MTDRVIAGVRVAIEGEAEPARRLLDRLPPGDGGAADLIISLRGGGRFEPRADDRPLMYHSAVRVLGRRGAIHVTDGASELVVAPGGARLEGYLHADSLADAHVVENELLTIALVIALRWHGRFHLHAAATDGPGGGILVPGGSGAGKSTLALALVEAGQDYLSDDAVLIVEREGAPAVVGLPRTFHVSPATADAFPAATGALSPGPAVRGKRALDPRRAFPGRERASPSRPKLILFPRVTGRATSALEPITPSEAFGALLESSAVLAVDGMPGVEGQLALLRAIVDGATCARAGLGLDLLAQPGAVAVALLDRAAPLANARASG